MRPRTSWMSVLVGWLAGLGALNILLPLALVGTARSPAIPRGVDDPLLALPIVGAVFAGAVVAGYAAGRMAGVRRSWHGLLAALWGTLVALAGALVVARVAEVATFPSALARPDLATFGDAYTFGGALAFAAAIVGGWLGGLISPAPTVPAATPAGGPPARARLTLLDRLRRRPTPARTNDGGTKP